MFESHGPHALAGLCELSGKRKSQIGVTLVRRLTEEETHAASGGAVPVGVAVGLGVAGGAAQAAATGGNIGQIVAGGLLGGVAAFWGAVGGTLQLINAAALGVIGAVATNGQSGGQSPSSSGTSGTVPGASLGGGSFGRDGGGLMQIQDPHNMFGRPMNQFGF